ncbi:MAG: polymerase, sigma-24 subunit, subfamily [Bacteroidetes bacterium]|jgi:RNA polymerase sigma-70 factor (family 1)|nr:polymerase, sigma-24 subunit, subfamily [Bacteroidota bacterium]
MQIKGQEAELLSRLQKGDEKAFTELFYAFYDKLFGYVLGITHSKLTAEDITQEVFLKVWQNKAEMVDVENINALLFRITQNRAIDYLRKSAREVLAVTAHLELESPNNVPEPLDLIIQDELKSRISEAVEHLPPQQKKIYILYKEQGIKQDEIASRLNISRSTVQSHMKLAMTNIHKYLSSHYPDLLIIAILISILKKNVFF